MNQNGEMIKQLYNQFDKIQSKLGNKPVLGAPKWHLTDYKLMNQNRNRLIKIYMEDGHIENTAILQYSKETNSFNIIKETLI